MLVPGGDIGCDNNKLCYGEITNGYYKTQPEEQEWYYIVNVEGCSFEIKENRLRSAEGT